ncbi:hypothetical protein VPH35_015211 [Triticum aestivum]
MRRRTSGSTLLLHLPTNAPGPSCCSPPPRICINKTWQPLQSTSFNSSRSTPPRSHKLAAKSPRSIEPEMALDAAAAGHLDRSHQPMSAQRGLVAAPLMGIGHYLQLQVASTCSCRERRLAAGGGVDLKLATHATMTYCHNGPPPTAGAAAPRPFNYATSGRSTMPPAIVDSICFLPLYAASSMSYSPLLCLEERRELVQLWLLLCWYVCFSEGTILSLYSLSVYE